jgi:hypothetical protein
MIEVRRRGEWLSVKFWETLDCLGVEIEQGGHSRHTWRRHWLVYNEGHMEALAAAWRG